MHILLKPVDLSSLDNLMEAMAPVCNSHRLPYSSTLVSVQFLGFLSVIEYEVLYSRCSEANWQEIPLDFKITALVACSLQKLNWTNKSQRLASFFANLNCLTDIRSLIHPLSFPLHYNPLHPIPLTLSLRNALEAARSDQNPVPLAIDGPDLCFYFMKSGRKFWQRTHIASPAGGRLLANTLSNTQFLLQFKKY